MSTGYYKVDDEGDVVMGMPQPIYEVIKAPMLTSLEQSKLIKWSEERIHYINKIKERCAVTGESFAAVVTSIRSSMDPDLFSNLCEYVLKQDEALVTDDDLEAYIMGRCNKLKNEYLPDIPTLFKSSLRMDLSIDDVDARVLKYFSDFNRIIKNNGLGGVLGKGQSNSTVAKNRMKTRCSLLVDNLQPAVLRTQVQRMISLGDHFECKSDDVKLHDLILDQAKLQHRFHKQSKEAKDSRDAGTPKPPHPGRRDATKPQPTPPTREAKPPLPARPRAAPAPPSQSTQQAQSKPRTGCMHCKGDHWVRDCSQLSDAEKQVYLARIPSKDKPKVEPSRAFRTDIEQVSGSGLHIRINDIMTVPMVVDSGADRTMVPASVVAELQTVCPSVAVTRLDPPLTAEVADGQVVTCEGTVLLDLQVITAAGPVNLRQVTCVVLPTTRAEVLLGDETLRALGIDVNRQLELLAARPVPANEIDDFALPEVCPVDHGSITDRLQSMADAAVENGLDRVTAERLRLLVLEFQDCFRENLGPDPPALVEPLHVTLQDGVTPVRCRARKYAPLQSTFLKEYTQLLEANGLIRRNNMARWASPAVPIRKPGTNDFRMTIDYRAVNSVTVPIVGTMPNLAVALPQVMGSVGFAKFDLMKGFWQMPLDEESQEKMSFMTEDTVFTPTRVPQGSMDSAVHFQNQLQVVFRPLLNRHCLIWIDDIIVFAPDVTSLLSALREFFVLVEKHNLKLSLSKSVLFMTEVLWCGRVVSGQGVTHDPERIAALSKLPPPPTVAALQQFLCAVNWLRDSLLDYARVSAVLYEKLEAAMRTLGRRNKNGLQAAITWESNELKCFNAVCGLVSRSCCQFFADNQAELCMFTDASAIGWSIIVTQVREWKSDFPVHAQAHQLIVCKGGLFKGSEKNWSVVEKEAFPIVKACADLEYLLLREKGFRLYCDHANLIHIFDPSAELKRHVRDKLQRWAMRLCGLPYVIEHINGENNVWADLVSRWGQAASQDDAVRVLTVSTRRTVAPSALRPLNDASFSWPTVEDVKRAQQQYRRSAREVPHTREQGMIIVDGLFWIPSEAQDLLVRLMVIAHCGSQGHRGEDPMVTLLSQRFYVAGLAHHVHQFVQGCLLCKHVKGGKLIQRPWGPTFTATARNEGIHWDFLKMGESYGANKYVLVVKDSLTHYCELFPCASADAEAAASGLLEWYKRYGCPELLVSDQGSHFRNQTLQILCARLKIQQEFTPVYSPWINGTVERVNRDILQVVRVLLLEYGLDTREWPYLLPVIQANLNQTPVASLADHAPIELFLGLPAPSALDAIVRPADRTGIRIRTVHGEDIRESLAVLKASLHAMHREVVDKKEKRRLQAITKKNGHPANFDVGDYVLWSRVDQRLSSNKLLAQWIGPFEVVEAKERSFMIRHLLSGVQYEVHASRLKYYADSSLNRTEEIDEFVSNQGIALGVARLVAHRFNTTLRRWEIKVSWVGLQEVEDSWEPLSSLMADIPVMTRLFAADTDDDQFQAAVEAATRSE